MSTYTAARDTIEAGTKHQTRFAYSGSVPPQKKERFKSRCWVRHKRIIKVQYHSKLSHIYTRNPIVPVGGRVHGCLRRPYRTKREYIREVWRTQKVSLVISGPLEIIDLVVQTVVVRGDYNMYRILCGQATADPDHARDGARYTVHATAPRSGDVGSAVTEVNVASETIRSPEVANIPTPDWGSDQLPLAFNVNTATTTTSALGSHGEKCLQTGSVVGAMERAVSPGSQMEILDINLVWSG